jgi:hypothetical protein
VVVSDIPEHHALLGSDYPYYVPLDAAPEEAAHVIGLAWTMGDTTNDRIYAHARKVLAASAPEQVARAYTDAFTGVIARTRTSGRIGRLVCTANGRIRKPRR